MAMRESANLPHILLRGGIALLATDTLYGLVARAEDRAAVERLYAVKRRRPDKPFIILIASIAEVQRFGVAVDTQLKTQLQGYWPGRVSVILPCPHPEWAYLHRGTQTLAFRIPAKATLRRLLRQTGPLVAPSANPEGLTPARTLAEAQAYFGDEVDYYRRGRTRNQASTIVAIQGRDVRVLRQGN